VKTAAVDLVAVAQKDAEAELFATLCGDAENVPAQSIDQRRGLTRKQFSRAVAHQLGPEQAAGIGVKRPPRIAALDASIGRRARLHGSPRKDRSPHLFRKARPGADIGPPNNNALVRAHLLGNALRIYGE
jgi:hypothetical protein